MVDTTVDTTTSDITWSLAGPNSGRVWEAIAAVMAELPGIEKASRNTQQGFDFRSIDDITAQSRKLFGKHGLAIAPRVQRVDFEPVKSSKGTDGFRAVAYVDYLIGHSEGGEVGASMVGEAIDYGDKATSKAVQMAFKYLLTELLQIGSGGDDPDGQSPDVSRPQPVEAMGRGVPLSELEIAERATNKLKGDILGIVGDRERAVKAYRDAVSSLGLDPDGPVPGEEHERVLAIVQALEEPADAAAALPLDDADAAPFEEPQ